MCLSIPSKVVKISEDNTMCTVDTMGVQRDTNLMMMEDDDIKVGDYVLLHIGFVMNKIDEEERKRAILEDDECLNRGSSEQ